MPSAYDWGAIFTGVPGVLAGSWQRIGNVVRQYAFSEYCELVPPPDAPPPTTWTFLGEMSAVSPASGMMWIASPYRLPATAKDIRAERVAYSGRTTRMIAGFVYPALATDTASTWLYSPPGMEYSHMSPDFTTSNLWDTLNYSAAVDAFSPQQPVLAVDQPEGASITVRFYYRPRVAEPTPYVPPALPTAPPGVQAAPSCPSTPDTQALGDYMCELHHKIDALDRKLDDLLETNVPPEYTADDAETAVADPEAPIIKPSTAIGIAVRLSLPPGIGRYGVNPGAYPGAGHVVLGTADGWLPSIPLKHNPQLVLPLPFQVSEIGLDLAPGVGASYRWLWPGRPVG